MASKWKSEGTQPMDAEDIQSSPEPEQLWGWLVMLKLETGSYKNK